MTNLSSESVAGQQPSRLCLSFAAAFLHDFSYAGAFKGEAPLPELVASRFDALDYGADAEAATDSAPAFQAAIDAASVAGGVVWVPSGTYRVDGRLRVEASNVILAGERPCALPTVQGPKSAGLR